MATAATLFFVESRNPPVFKSPLRITFTDEPKVGEAFFFNTGHLSVVQEVVSMQNYRLIKTLNSIYMLRIKEKK